MRSNNIGLATLAWLDRRRLWASANRATSLGAAPVPTLPSALGGQSSRPGVSYRSFSPHLPRLPVAALFGSGLALALSVVGPLLGLAPQKLSLLLDRALSSTGPKEPQKRPLPEPGSRGLGESGPSLNFARLLYSVVGSLGASPSTPLCPLTGAPRTGSWEAAGLPPMKGGWALGLSSPNAAPVRAYLGEWRRLADQSSGALAPLGAQGHVRTTRAWLVIPGSRAPAHPAWAAHRGRPGASAANSPKAYPLYLSSPWVL